MDDCVTSLVCASIAQWEPSQEHAAAQKQRIKSVHDACMPSVDIRQNPCNPYFFVDKAGWGAYDSAASAMSNKKNAHPRPSDAFAGAPVISSHPCKAHDRSGRTSIAVIRRAHPRHSPHTPREGEP